MSAFRLGYQTPNIDPPAQTGARLDKFNAQPLCTPTRAALMTGRYPSAMASRRRYSIGPHLRPGDRWMALAQALKEVGYPTAIIGKWHLGHADPKYVAAPAGLRLPYGPLIGEIDYFTHKQHGVVDWCSNGQRGRERLFDDPAR